MMIEGAESSVSASSAVMLRRLTITMWSCESVHTPPTCPVIHRSGRGFGQDGSTSNFSAFCAGKASAKRNSPVTILIIYDLLELSAAQIDGLNSPHVGYVLERAPPQHQQVRGLTSEQRTEILVDAQALRRAFGKRLDHLHRRQPRVHHQLHLPVLGESLDEKTVERPAA